MQDIFQLITNVPLLARFITILAILFIILVANTVVEIAVTNTDIEEKQKKHRKSAVLSFVLAAITLAAAYGITSVYTTAMRHGATLNDLNEMPVMELVQRVSNSHPQSEISEDDIKDFKDCYIMYFRFSCGDCRDTYKDSQKFLKENDPGVPVYYIATDSEIGKKLLGKYGIAEVPGLVYIYPDGRTFMGKVLYYKQKDVKGAVFDANAALELYQFREDLLKE